MNKTLLVLALAAAVSSCATTEQITTTEHPIGPKTGKARALFIMGIPVSTASQVEAARKADIDTIATAEVVRSRFFFFGFRTFIVNGN